MYNLTNLIIASTLHANESSYHFVLVGEAKVRDTGDSVNSVVAFVHPIHLDVTPCCSYCRSGSFP